MAGDCFVVSWDNLVVDAVEKTQKFWKTKIRKKCLLNNSSGQIRNKSLTAIMGSSGAGKTTLLAALSGRMKEKRGKLLINNVEVDAQAMKSVSGYLYQDCIFVESLTVNEHITFMAALKLNHFGSSKRKQICTKLLQDLSLFSCGNSRLKILSGGERKRLALGVELLNDPDILFCDEPTTGLDSNSAITVIGKLEELADLGKLVIVTIHQPSSQLFDYFTHLILLSSGQLLYHGTSQNGIPILERHFANHWKPPSNTIEVLRTFNGFRKLSTSSFCSELPDSPDYPDSPSLGCNGQSPEFKDYSETNGSSPNLTGNGNGNSQNSYKWPKKLNVSSCLFSEVFWLVWRESIDLKRNYFGALMQFSLLMISALIVGTIYKDVSIADVNSEQNITGLLYFLTTELLFTQVYSVINTIPEEFCVFLREKQLYSTHAYFISKVISMMPRSFIQPSVYLAIVFTLIHFLDDAILFVQMLSVLFVACITSSALGLCISAHFTSIQYMDLFLVPFDAFSLIITGAALQVQYLPGYIAWAKYLSPFSYTYQSLAILQWSKVGNITEIGTNNITIHIDGIEILENLGYPSEPKYAAVNAIYLCTLSLCLCILGYIGLVIKKNKYHSY